MAKSILGALAALLTGATLAAAQPPAGAPPAGSATGTAAVVLGRPIAVDPQSLPAAPASLGRPRVGDVVQTVALDTGAAMISPAILTSSAPAASTPRLARAQADTIPEPPPASEPPACAGPPLLGPCSCPCDECPRFWISGEYLLWWIKDGPVPVPLVTTGSVMDAQPGAIGQPNTRTLFGNQPLDYGTFSGGRITAGYWFTDDQCIGIEGSGFLLQQQTTQFAARSDANGNPLIVGRPINAFGINAVDSSFPGKVFGGIAIGSQSQLWGADANAVGRIFRCGPWSMDWLAGFRYLDLREGLVISDSSQVLPGQTFGVLLRNGQIGQLGENTGYAITDSFKTRNQFYGGQVGTRTRFCWEGLTVDLSTKVALGDTQETRVIGGSNTLFFPGQSPLVNSGGSLTNPGGNIGHVTRGQFSVVPEVGLTVGYQVFPWMRVTAGYNFLYWSGVVRPGNQVSLTGSISQSAPPLVRSDFWAQGATVGLEFVW